MASRIEDYALLGDCETAALVGRDGSVDWLCVPRFDSGACFAALLGMPEHGRWLLTPNAEIRGVRRRYRPGTLILETEYTTDTGVVALIDFMPLRDTAPELVRIVQGKRGQVPMRLELVIRFDYGSIVPWVRRQDGGIRAIAGPNRLRFQSDVACRGENLKTVADFSVAAGDRVHFTLTWHPSHKPEPPLIAAEDQLRETEQWWNEWSGKCKFAECSDNDRWCAAVLRSLITLKALTYAPTGGIVAAPTTSLPEQIGGVRNWDYRICWIRDATFTLYSLVTAGYLDEAKAWREWLLRAVAGEPAKVQIMYGLAGERRLTEFEIGWLPGYENSRPVRIGNAAAEQFQLDVYGELADVVYQCRRHGLEPDENAWRVGRLLFDWLESAWDKPDEGIWEIRGPRRPFTHSRMMAWVAFDRAIKSAETYGLEAPLDRWRKTRDAIHEQVCREGFNPDVGAFVQYYGAKWLDASLLMMPLVGFLPASDPRVRGTVAAIEKHLMRDGFIERYPTESNVDGLPPGEGVFLPCTFWYADNLTLLGRTDEATDVFERMLGLCNDVGLISEEYDPHARRLLGNFPQAFTHVGLVNTALNLAHPQGPAEHRKES